MIWHNDNNVILYNIEQSIADALRTKHNLISTDMGFWPNLSTWVFIRSVREESSIWKDLRCYFYECSRNESDHSYQKYIA
jgi:hypothetical protein